MKKNSANSLISVITPTYNAEEFIKETIQSVQDQTYPNWEMVIVDDCSTDRTVELIEKEMQNDSRIKLIQQEVNQGAAAARNKSIRASQGDYIAFLDSDDLWHPEKLEKQLHFMRENNYAFSFTGYELMNEEGEEKGKVIHVPSQVEYTDLLKNTIIGCLTVMLDINKLGKVQMPDIRTRQDTALWLSILREGATAYGLQESLSKYRRVKGSISSNKLKMAHQTWKMYREIEQLPFGKALWSFLHYAFNAFKKNF